VAKQNRLARVRIGCIDPDTEVAVANLLQISWWNDHDLGDILYQDGFKNIIFLDVEVDKPEYNTTIESDLNGDNVEIAKFRKWEKVYRFEFWGQEDLVDAFSIMQIHDNIEVTLQSGEVIEVAKHGLRAEVAWEEIGCLAKISVSFTENYTVAGNCDENKDVECYCVTHGEFNNIEDYSTPGPAGDLDYVLRYTVENIAGKKYTAKLYQFHTSGGAYYTEQVVEQYACYENLDDSTFWFFDGQFWHLSPGYIISLTQTSPPNNPTEVKAWILPGTFCTLYYHLSIGWVDAGDFTFDEIDSGVTVNPPENGNIEFKLAVWNHSCDYGETEEMIINLT
jgi:hypothetical protein